MQHSAGRRTFLGVVAVPAVLPAVVSAQPAASGADEAQRSGEPEVRALIARWYEESRKRSDGRRYLLVGRGGIVDRRPPCETGELPAALSIDALYSHELTWRALRFEYEIGDLRIDPNFARVEVHERGWMFAADPQVTYRNDAFTLFLLERDVEGAWKVMAHQSDGRGLLPEDRNAPMPDLRDEYYDLIGAEPPPR